MYSFLNRFTDSALKSSVWRKMNAFVREQLHQRNRNTEQLSQASWNQFFLPDHFTKSPSKMHVWLCDQLDGLQARRGAKLNIIAPRGGAKSTIGSLAYPLRCALEGWEPLIWIVSETHDQAVNHLQNIRAELLDNQRIHTHYPFVSKRGSVWKANRIRLKNKVTIEAYGIGQKIRGRRQGAHRPSLILCDDLQSDQVMFSARTRERDWSWFNSLLLKAGNKRTNVIHVATALHREAIALELLNTTGWTSRVFSAIEHWPNRQDLWERWSELYHDLESQSVSQLAREFFESHKEEMEQGAELLWPEEEDLYTLMCMREDQGQLTFEREKQGHPVNPEQCEWPESYFEGDLWFDDWPTNLVLKAMALDPSKGKDAKRGDYSAYVMIGLAENGLVYVEADLARRPTATMIQDGVMRYQQFRPNLFGVEANHYQELLAGEFIRQFREYHLPPIEPSLITNHTSKVIRIRSLGPWLSQRKFRFRRNSPGSQLLISQLRDFPDPHTHDDGPDALEMALRLAASALNTETSNDLLAGMDRLMLD